MSGENSLETRCHVCNKQLSVMKRCTKCKSVMYCSRECQVKDWPSHQIECKSTTTIPIQETCGPGQFTRNDNSIFDEAKHGDTKRNRPRAGNQATTVHHPPLVDFSKALPKSSVTTIKPEGKTYLHNNHHHIDVPELDEAQPMCTITLKCNKEKHNIKVQNSWTGCEVYKYLSYSLKIPLENLKIIYKGKVLSSDNISDTVKNRSVYQVIGELAEDEDGVDQRDISVMMEQMGLDRNTAIQALKRKEGNLLDALLDMA